MRTEMPINEKDDMYSEAHTESASEATRRVRDVVDLAVINETEASGVAPDRPLTPQVASALRPNARSMLTAYRAERNRRRVVSEAEMAVHDVLEAASSRSLRRDMAALADPG